MAEKKKKQVADAVAKKSEGFELQKNSTLKKLIVPELESLEYDSEEELESSEYDSEEEEEESSESLYYEDEDERIESESMDYFHSQLQSENSLLIVPLS